MVSSEQFESESVGEETNRLQKRLGSQMNQQAHVILSPGFSTARIFSTYYIISC